MVIFATRYNEKTWQNNCSATFLCDYWFSSLKSSPIAKSYFTSTAALCANCFPFVAKHQASLCFTHLTSTFLPLIM